MAYTVGKLLELTTGHFKKMGILTPRLDAEVLLADLLGVERIKLYMDYQKPLNQNEVDGYRERVIKRSRGIPVAYITGKKEFMSLSFKVREGVLIPRPETELLVERVMNLLEEKGARVLASGREHFSLEESEEINSCFKIADIGTGSGAIALSLACYLPGIRVEAIDISEQALELARENAAGFGLKNVTFRYGSFLEPLRREGIKVDGVVSNPPYIPSKEIEGLSREVQHEPRQALDGGSDGLFAYREIIASLPGVLKDGGFVALEIGHDQKEEISRLLQQSGFKDIAVHADLAGHPRVVMASFKKE